ncbi:MAG: methyltransferase domain-containing protein [Rhodanobacteraceae bacterium]|nr:MAG: methyltransferase domain-containing protein [Rhodanobacteraceae bacterium]
MSRTLNPPPRSDSTYAWDQYWHTGRLASCGGEGGVNYQPFISEGWKRFFSRLSDGARILDVCAGNGAVARLAAESASARNLHVAIEAVDSAALHPAGLESSAGMIHFSPRTQAEDLPFPDASFDVIVGQYAIEYTDVERTLAELRRVSRQATTIRFVTHAAGSVVVQGAKDQLDDAERLTATGIFPAAATLARAASGDSSAPSFDVARANFRNALQALQVAASSTMDLRMYQNVGTVLVDAIQKQPRAGVRAVLDKINETELAIKAHQARLSAMRRAALDAEGAQALAARAERLWARKFELERLARPDGAQFGWVVVSGTTEVSTIPAV